MKRILFLLICLPVLGWSQSVIVSGNVSDNIDIVPGVNVIEKGTTNGTTTDFNGNYEISVSSNKSILVFSYVGYASQEITVSKQRTLNIKLIEDAQALDAVVVRGFTGVVGKARKRTESIQNIKLNPVLIFIKRVSASLDLNVNIPMMVEYIIQNFWLINRLLN
jgi:iron complex outermembrane receptor protein